MTINEEIKSRREALNLSLKEFSKKVRISIKTLEKYEKGELKIPKDNLKKIAASLGITVEKFNEISKVIKNTEIEINDSSQEIIENKIMVNEQELIDIFNKLDEKDKYEIIQIIKGKISKDK